MLKAIIEALRRQPAFLPVLIYFICLLLSWLVAQFRRDVLREDFFRLGSDWSRLSVAVCIAAIVDPGSRFRVAFTGEEFAYAAGIGPIILLIVFGCSNYLFRWLKDKTMGQVVGVPSKKKQVAASIGTHVLGLAALYIVWNLR